MYEYRQQRPILETLDEINTVARTAKQEKKRKIYSNSSM